MFTPGIQISAFTRVREAAEAVGGAAAWYGARPPTPQDQSDASDSPTASQASIIVANPERGIIVAVPENHGGWIGPAFDEAVQVRYAVHLYTASSLS